MILNLDFRGQLAALAALLLGCWALIVSVTSGSWVLFVGAVGFTILALFYLIIDIWGFRKWAFFFVVISR